MLGEVQATQDLLDAVRKKFEAEVPKLNLDHADWSRLKFAYDLAVGESVLDVGTGHGVLVHLLANSGFFPKVSGFDIRTHSQALLRDDVTYFHGSIADRTLQLPEHDTIVCMEVIEHLEEIHNEVMLSNLRKVAKERLVVTVPFEEPEPVWWHDKPGGHRQSFTMKKLELLFPNAIASLFPRYGIDWIFIVEDSLVMSKRLKIVQKDTLIDIFRR